MLRFHLRPAKTKALLQVFLVADQHIDVGYNPPQGLICLSRPPEICHSLARKFRSKEITAPAALAAFIPSMMTSGVVGDRAAKIPPLWNHRTPPPVIAFQSKSPGLSSAPASFERL